MFRPTPYLEELQLVCTCASVSVANIHFEKAERGRKLKNKIAELGRAVLVDRSKTRVESAFGFSA
jgi:hypothetical protein